MGLTGNFSGFDAIRERIREASMFRQELHEQLGAEALTQIGFGFEESRDPYGKRWEPIHNRRGRPLLDTGRLRNSFRVVVTATGFVVNTDVVYAPPHQYGGKKRRRRQSFAWPAQRQFMPEREIGPIWKKAFDDAASELLRQKMGV